MVSPNANDIIVRSPNVHAEHAKKFNKKIPVNKKKKYGKINIYYIYRRFKRVRKSVLYVVTAWAHLRIRPTMHLAGDASSTTIH